MGSSNLRTVGADEKVEMLQVYNERLTATGTTRVVRMTSGGKSFDSKVRLFWCDHKGTKHFGQPKRRKYATDNDVLRGAIKSCGCLSAKFFSTLKRLPCPLKFVDGRPEEGEGTDQPVILNHPAKTETTSEPDPETLLIELHERFCKKVEFLEREHQDCILRLDQLTLQLKKARADRDRVALAVDGPPVEKQEVVKCNAGMFGGQSTCSLPMGHDGDHTDSDGSTWPMDKEKT